MNFCPKCGRQRIGGNRFCRDCGNDFGEPTSLAPEPVAEVSLTAAVPIAAEPTRREPMPAAAESAVREPADQARWDALPQAREYPPPSQPVPMFPPPAHSIPTRRSGGGKGAAFVVVAVLIALAAGGGAYALVSRSSGHTTGQPTIHPTVAARASAIVPTTQASATASPTLSPSASVTPSPSQTGTVQVAPGVASNPAAPMVDAYLNRYFNSINTRNYSEYNSLLDRQEQQSSSQASFDSGFATTKDSNEVLTGITETGGNLIAAVSFSSHQSPADSIDHSACNNWQLSLYLVPQGHTYVMTAAPADYTAAHTDC